MKTAFRHKVSEEYGFTLLEVMIAVSIISIVFVSLFRMQSGTIELATAGSFNRLAPVLAKKLLAQIEMDVVNFSEINGDFGDEYPYFQWQCEFSDILPESEELISEDSPYGLKQIDITIVGASSNTYKISTWRAFSE